MSQPLDPGAAYRYASTAHGYLLAGAYGHPEADATALAYRGRLRP